ncbi:MAG: glycosyltransferase 87 family protein [Eubacteriales bacterium]|nr:glycosyltransferase 87 family protein [Eubacteriales bacterium]
MQMLGAGRKNLEKIGLIMLLGAILVFAVGSAVLDVIWQARGGILARVFAWALIFAFLGWALFRQMKPAFRPDVFGGLLALLALVLWIRFPLMSFQSSDYIDCLQEWAAAIRQAPGFTSLSQTIGDYNVPYFYLLFVIAKLTTVAGELYWIKLISIAFEAIGAIYIMRILSSVTKNKVALFASMFAFLLLPTVVSNGSAWGQCDAIYTSLSLAGLYYGLNRRSKLAYLFFALAFSFKLQTIFFLLPAIALLLSKRIRWKDVWVFLAVFCALLLPALIAGRPLANTLLIYYKQAGYYEWLHFNAPTIFGFFDSETSSSMFARAGIFAAGAVFLAFALYLYVRRDRLNTERILEAAYLSLLIIPFLLPNMHERYFFAADVFGVVYLMCHLKRWYVPVIGVISSLLTYLPFLFRQEMAIPLSVLSIAMLGIICLVARDFIKSVEADRSCEPGEICC